MPKISIIIPIYNVAKYIEKCVCSLMEQTLDDIEYIFVNDCTLDNSIEILQKTLEKYPNRKDSCKIIHHDTNKGPAVTRNTGLELAIGEYIAFCDSDDWVEITMYEELYNKAKKENADIVYSDIKMISTHSSHIYSASKFSDNKPRLIKNYISFYLILPHFSIDTTRKIQMYFPKNPVFPGGTMVNLTEIRGHPAGNGAKGAAR